MRTRRIGTLQITVVGLGCNNFGGRTDAAGTTAVVGAALDAGINFFDTADIYGNAQSEELLGKALGSRRDEVVIATKFGFPYADRPGGASPTYIRTAIEESLRRIGTDRIDLFQLHIPDPTVDIADTLGALGELVAKGKVREIGCSNFTDAMLTEADRSVALGAPRFVSVQNEYSILHRDPEDDVLGSCDRLRMAFLPYFPLAKGLLTGKYRAGKEAPAGTRLATLDEGQRKVEFTEARFAQVAALAELAVSEGRSMVDLAVAWLLSHDVVASVIAGATRSEQVRANAAAAEFLPSAQCLARIDEIAPR